MNAFLRYSGAFLSAVFSSSLLASVFSTQFVLAGLVGLGIPIPFTDRLGMTFADFGILPAMAVAVTACFLPAFALAGFAASRLGGSRRAWFAVAASAGLVAELLIMSAMLGLMPVAGARTTAGLAAQGVAGAAGGWLFATMTRRRTTAETAVA